MKWLVRPTDAREILWRAMAMRSSRFQHIAFLSMAKEAAYVA